jgi:hypothetical protein
MNDPQKYSGIIEEEMREFTRPLSYSRVSTALDAYGRHTG